MQAGIKRKYISYNFISHICSSPSIWNFLQLPQSTLSICLSLKGFNLFAKISGNT